MKFTQKLTLSILLLVCAVLSIGGAWTIEQNLSNALDQAQREYTGIHLQERIVIERLMQEESITTPSQITIVAQQYIQQFQSAVGTRQTHFSLISGEGNFLYSYMPRSVRYEQQIAAMQAGETGLFYSREKGGDYLLLASPLQNPVEEIWLISAYDIGSLYAERNRQLKQYLCLECTVLFLACIVAWGVARVLTRPLRSLETAAQKIAAGQYEERVIPGRGSDEVAILGHSFNAMADTVQNTIAELQQQAESRQRFVQALTHEIKTPMTTILGYSDLLRLGEQPPARRQLAADFIYHEASRLEKLSKQLLRLFGLEKEQTELTQVRVMTIFGDVQRSLGKTFSLQLEIQCDPEAQVLGNRLLLADLCLNLLHNAEHAGSQDGKVTLACTRCPAGWVLSVTDTGRGIAKEDLEHLTEPFYMVDKSRARKNGGSGLGLSLCEEIARRHNSTLQFESEPGRGTCVYLVLQEVAADAEQA